MKNFIIFLLLFCFGFGAYCASVEYTFTQADNVPSLADDPDNIAGVYFNLPAGTYDVTIVSVDGVAGAQIRCIEFRNGGPTDRHYWDYAQGTRTSWIINTDTSQFFWGWARPNGSVTIRIEGENLVEAPLITSATSISATAGTAFTYNITATGTTPITYTIANLPVYLTLSGSIVSGTLPFSNTDYVFFYDIVATNAADSDTKRVTVNVTAAGLPVWFDTITNNYNVGDSLSITIRNSWIVSGLDPMTFSKVSGSLPPGVTLSNGVLTGTFTTGGVFTFTCKAENSVGIANKDITYTVNGSSPMYIGADPCVIDVTRGLQFSYDLGASFWSNADTVTMSGLPVWATITNNILSGVVPSDEIRQNITGLVMTASNGVGDSVITGVEIVIYGIGDSLYFTSPSTAQGVINQPFSYNATVNQPSGVSYSMSNAPSWLSCSSSGSVTGTVPEGITGFSFTVTASHVEFASVSLTVNCTAVVSGEENTLLQHVIVDNFEDFGTTQWAKDMKGFLANSSQEFAGLNLGINAINNRLEISNQELYSINTGVDATNANLIKINDDMNVGFGNVHTDLTGLQNTLDDIHGNTISINNSIGNLSTVVVDNLDDIKDLLTGIKTDINENPVISPMSLALPSYEFSRDFGDFTAEYTSGEIDNKTKVAQFDFVTGKLNNLLDSQPAEPLKLEVPFVGTVPGATENPSITVSTDLATSPYVAMLRMFFSIIVYIIGSYWWLTIVMGFFA